MADLFNRISLDREQFNKDIKENMREKVLYNYDCTLNDIIVNIVSKHFPSLIGCQYFKYIGQFT